MKRKDKRKRDYTLLDWMAVPLDIFLEVLAKSSKGILKVIAEILD